MPYEQSKSCKRRYNIGAFHQRYFVGAGIDIGGKHDPLTQHIGTFPLMKSIKVWDIESGDAQHMVDVADNTYDFVCSSHCLEHMVDPKIALENWVRITKPGGYLIITVPEEDLYEMGHWPSQFNVDHKHTFCIYKKKSWSPASINIIDLLKSLESNIEIEKIELIRDFYHDEWAKQNIDQTATIAAECCIEFILRKK